MCAGFFQEADFLSRHAFHRCVRSPNTKSQPRMGFTPRTLPAAGLQGRGDPSLLINSREKVTLITTSCHITSSHGRTPLCCETPYKRDQLGGEAENLRRGQGYRMGQAEDGAASAKAPKHEPRDSARIASFDRQWGMG